MALGVLWRFLRSGADLCFRRARSGSQEHSRPRESSYARRRSSQAVPGPSQMPCRVLEWAQQARGGADGLGSLEDGGSGRRKVLKVTQKL